MKHALCISIASFFLACFAMTSPAAAYDPYNDDGSYDGYDAPYSGPYVGDGYDEWHPEFRSREARYRRRYRDERYDARPVRRHHRQRYRGGEYEEEFWVGNCKIEREWERDGSYEDDVDCD